MPETTENYHRIPVTRKEAKQWVKKHKSSADISVEAVSLIKDIQALYREAKQEVLQNLN